MFQLLWAALWALAVQGASAQATAAPTTGPSNAIVTGGSNGTYFPMARNLQKYAAPGLEVRESKGSWENIFRLAKEPGVSFAMVQSDVLGHFNQWVKTQQGAADVKRSVASLQVMLPLHEEEVHVLVARASKLKYLHELRGLRIFMGRPGSGPFITGHQLYRILFGEEPTAVVAEDFKLGEAKLEIEAALMSLVGTSSGKGPAVDAVLLVGGQPYGAVETLEKRKETAAKYKFLVSDPASPASAKLLQHYRPAKFNPQYYEELLRGSASADTFAVQAYLVTVELTDARRRRFVEDFASNYCKNFAAMVADPESHKKWSSVTWKPGRDFPKLAEGWRSVPGDVVKRLTRCSSTAPPKEKGAPRMPPCTGVPHPTMPGKCL